MKLKSVELIGFKSFARKTKINFHPGITEIVGPNGSGKSNIIEAIRWALGEQSAKNLRSSRMTDVIFSGSQSHPALNRAKVTLDFDNHDHYIHTNYDDLTVSRTVYRDGTNNYYINNEPCRLRDVQDLFMNTGIGNGSFSIISQGKVSQIFKSKPEDRRFIIETVAGIYKYRSQKRVASKKLAKVNQNLARLQDINYELSNQFHSLKSARKKAVKYLKLKHVANHLDINRLLIRNYQLSQRRTKEITNYHKLMKRLALNNSKINQFKQLRLKLRKRISETSKRSNQFQNKMLRISHRSDQLSNQQTLNHQKIGFWRNQIKQNQDHITVTNQQVDVLNSQLFKLTALVNHDKQRTRRLRGKLNRLKRPQLSGIVRNDQDQINKLRTNYLTLIKKSVSINGKIINLRQNRKSQTVRVLQAKKRRSKIHKLNTQLNQQIKVVDSALNKLRSSILKHAKDANQLAAQRDRTSQKLNSIKRTYQIQSRRKQTLLIRVNGLERMAHNHSNLNYGSRNLLNHAEQFPGVLGPVAKFIKVPTKYIQAIETTLRSQLQQILVKNSETARQAITFMTERRLGRVTLLPINEISKRWVDSRSLHRASKCPGFIDIAANLVQMPSRFSAVKFHLLGNVLIANNVDSAINIGRVVHHRYRIVTLNGNVVNAGGAITGGHGRYHYHGLLAQKAKLNQYRKTLAELNRSFLGNNTRLSRLQRHLNQINGELATNQTNLDQNRQKSAIKVSLKDRLINEAKNYRKLLNTQQQLVHDDSGNDHRSIRELVTIRTKLRNKIAKNRHKLRRLQSEVNRKASVNNEVTRRYQQLREILIRSASKQNQDSLKHSTLNDKIKRATQAVDHYNQINLRLKRLINQQQVKLGHNQQYKQIQTKLRNLRKQKVTYHQEITQNQSYLTEVEERLSRLQDQLMNLRDQLNQNRLRIDNLNRKRDEVKETLLRKYQIDLQQRSLSVPKVSLYQISSKLLTVQKQLRKIGSADVNSIDRFKRVNHRYQFLSRQVNDLVTSKHQLITTMNQMNSKITSRFKATFDQVNRAFKITYSQIFRGGKAKLSLVDPHHLLTTGINIMAQPPGKRYRNMELLSGGERALTAIALLFAILKIKPAPFCILDEAESALDAINIDRFGDYMQKLKVKTQFIVITHRKTTMLYADNLYGVTMQNSGISKIISVNLQKAKAEG